MVDAVTGRAALALLSANSAADQTGNRKNPLLPTPLKTSQQGSGQRAPAILQFDTPKISPNTFSALQDSGLRTIVRQEVTLEERTRLEAEIRRRIQVTETGGDPGSPGTPDQTNIITRREGSLDSRALDALRSLIERFNGQPQEPSRFVPPLQQDIDGFSDRLNSDDAGDALAGVIRRIENSVIGEDGLQFADIFRDPALFLRIAGGLAEFSGETNHQAADALRDVIFRLGDRRLHDGNPRNDSLQSIRSAIGRLGRALEDEDTATSALQQFLTRIGGTPDDGSQAYGSRIAAVVQQTLNDLRGNALDLTAIEKLQNTINAVARLADIAGNEDDSLRQQAGQELRDILAQYAQVSERSQTVVTPGEPARPAVAPEKTLTVVEETTLVPRTEIARRVVAIYSDVQEQLRPLQKLSEPPPPTPSLQALSPPPAQDDEDGRNRFVIRARDDEDEDEQRFGIQAPETNRPGILAGLTPAQPGLASRNPGSLFDTRI